MNTQRIALRSSRALRAARPLRNPHQYRYQSSTSSSTVDGAAHTHSRTALYGGLAGAAAAILVGYTWYSFSGVKTAVDTARQAKSYFDASKNKLAQVAPEPNEALEWLRKQTHFYASFVPGGKQYVDSAFQDLDAVRQKHGGEVDQIVKDAYDELKAVTSKDLSMSTATEAWEVLQKHVKRIGQLAGDSANEIMNNHPELKEKIGGNLDQLKSLGDSLGPEANKLVTDTWSEVRNIVATGGVGAATVAKLKQLLEEKTEQIKKVGEQAWNKGVEELKPYLDKNPEIKQLIESNKKDLLSGNVMELWSKAKEAASSGNTEDFKNYVMQNVNKAQQKGGDASQMFEKYIDQYIPGGSKQLGPKFNQYKEMVQKTDTKGLEQLVKDTVRDLENLLSNKLEEGKKLVGDANNKKN